MRGRVALTLLSSSLLRASLKETAMFSSDTERLGRVGDAREELAMDERECVQHLYTHFSLNDQ
jgi:hypothetical protein